MNKNGSDTVVTLDDEAPKGAAPAAVVDEDAGPAAVVDEDADFEGGLPARAVENGDGTVTLPLRTAVTLTIRSKDRGERQQTFEELKFHRMAGSDMRAIMAASRDAQPVVMLARSTRLRQAVMNALFDRMDAADLSDAAQVCSHFFGSGRTTGR